MTRRRWRPPAQHQLLEAVETSGARLIEVGDPRQNQAVGAGGLWAHLEAAAREAGAHAELTQNQRANDPADRRDQALFRDGDHEKAVRGYAARDRVHHHPDPARAEDAALDAAHQDRQVGKWTIVIAQTSNDHLDELNARAQAIRHQNGELGTDSFPVTGRPYGLHSGDQVQVRRNVVHPEHGRLRNGTTAQIADIDPETGSITLRLADQDEVILDRELADSADLRLAYVQHPFPAQGQTTDTAHLIVSEHATQEGSYVALTRAREQTHIYAGDAAAEEPPDVDRLQALAERISRIEPDLPSIHTPLAHEHAITTEPDQPNSQPPVIDQTAPDPVQEPGPARAELPAARDLQPADAIARVRLQEEMCTTIEPHALDGADRAHSAEPIARDHRTAIEEGRAQRRVRRWPNLRALDRRDNAPEIDLEEPDRDLSPPGWER